MKKQKSNLFFYFFGILLLGVVAFLLFKNNSKPGEYDSFAKCLSESGAKMYGTWWCPHCSNQKKEFGSSWKIFADAGGYIECSTSDKQQTEICKQAGITSYPTWRFSDGSELNGEVDFYRLSQKSGCSLNNI